MGQGVTCAFGEAVGSAPDGPKVLPAVVATARLDPQLAPDGEQLATTRHVSLTERQLIEESERFAVATLGQENLDAQQPRFKRHLTAGKAAVVEI
jgi:hypothetical protein